MKYVLLLFAVASTASGQTISGSSVLSAQCNGTLVVPYTAGSGSGSLGGVCPAPGGSINDAFADWVLNPGHWFISHTATTDYFGSEPNGANAEARGLVIIEANDVVFTSTANPQSREFVRVSLNFLVGVTQARAGRSNCSLFTPNLSSTFSFRMSQEIRADGSRGYNLAQGEVASGLITLADPTDGRPVPHVTSSGFVQLTVRQPFTLTIDGYTNVTYCGQPPAPPERGVAASALRFLFPCDGPVFNLPAGITVNSVQLGIANNRWILAGTACCPADFNGDGFLDFFDYAEYVDCFQIGICPPGQTADFNGDGFTDFFDYADYVTAFEAGC
jgi:hypothetical protein